MAIGSETWKNPSTRLFEFSNSIPFPVIVLCDNYIISCYFEADIGNEAAFSPFIGDIVCRIA